MKIRTFTRASENKRQRKKPSTKDLLDVVTREYASVTGGAEAMRMQKNAIEIAAVER